MLPAVYISIIGLAFIASIVAPGRKHPAYVTIFTIILGELLIIEICANYFLRPLHLKWNTGLYNVALLIEFWGFGYYYYHVLITKKWKRLLKGYIVLFPVFWVIMVFIASKPDTWNSYMFIVGSISIIIMSVRMYYQLFTSSQPIKLFVNFEFWIATGLIIFFACNFFFLGMLNYLSENFRLLAYNLLWVLQVSNVVLYSMFIFAFICLRLAARQDRIAQ